MAPACMDGGGVGDGDAGDKVGEGIARDFSSHCLDT